MRLTLGNVAIFLSSQVCILGGALLALSTFIYRVTPFFVGSLDEPAGSFAAAMGFISGMVLAAMIGAVVGLLVWPVVLRPFVGWDRFSAFVGTEPRIRVPLVGPLFRRIVRFVYTDR